MEILGLDGFWLNNVLIVMIMLTYLPLLVFSFSPFKKLVEFYFEESAWQNNTNTANLASRHFSTITVVLASISLATVVFVIGQLPKNEAATVPGVVSILSSSVLFFWSLGLTYNASLNVNKPNVAAGFFKTGYYLGSFGVFLFFSGLIYSLNFVNQLYTFFSAIMYLIIFVFVGVIIPFQIRKKLGQK